ncbi:MAG: hypothetical protein QXU64_02100 [Thermofilaceae archaeon]
MSETGEEMEIRILMAKEIADDLCDPVEDVGERARCRAVLFRILARGSEFRELQALPEETRAIIRRGLAEMGVGE